MWQPNLLCSYRQTVWWKCVPVWEPDHVSEPSHGEAEEPGSD